MRKENSPILRMTNVKAVLTLNQLTNHLLQIDLDVIDNTNMSGRNLGSKI